MLKASLIKILVRSGDMVLGTHRQPETLVSQHDRVWNPTPSRATAPHMTKGQSRGFGPSCRMSDQTCVYSAVNGAAIFLRDRRLGFASASTVGVSTTSAAVEAARFS